MGRAAAARDRRPAPPLLPAKPKASTRIMALRLPDTWIWDFWFAEAAPPSRLTHVFFLQAERSLGDPEQRHWNVSIGHAVSRDLVAWDYRGTALAPSPGPAFDDATTWTGSVVFHDGLWWMFYTGNAKADDAKRQRIGLATSPDLATWTRHLGNPILDLPEGYEEYDPARWHDRSLRDPFVFRDPSGRGWRMLFTARRPDGPADEAGVIGAARSDDLVTWRALPPPIAPGIAGELEVPQYFEAGGRHYVLFCTGANRLSARFRAALGDTPALTGTHYFMAESPDGPWRLGPMPFFAGDHRGTAYAGRVHRAPDGRLLFFAFLNKTADGAFVGALSDPVPVRVHDDGRLQLETPVSALG